MKKESLVKALLMIGGGYLVFLLVKGSKQLSKSSGNKASMDGDKPVVNKDDAEIVMKAYSEALKMQEPPTKLTELNKEMMKEFGMRCYVADNGQLTVCDVKGNTILTK